MLLVVATRGAGMKLADSSAVLATDAVPMAPLLLRDMTLMLAQLKVESIRASLVDLASMEQRMAWSVTARGEFSDNPGTQRGDGSLPWAESMIAQLDDLQPEQTLVQKLSPRYWGFAWRYDDRYAAVAAVLYDQGRDEHDDAHNALVRLVCDIGIRAQEHAVAGSAADRPAVAWPAVERRRKLAARRKRLLAGVGAAILLTSTLTIAAMTFGRAATLQAEAARLQTLAESTMTHGLAAALATGDYGEVQAVLSSLSSLGYFKGAVVTNSRQRVISTAGAVGDARIGDNLLPGVAAVARTHELKQGLVSHGQLLILAADANAKGGLDRGLLLLMSVVMAGCAAIGAATLLFVLRYRGTAVRRLEKRPAA